MTVEEAQRIIQLDSYEDIEDAFDFKLFELKQFLLSKVPFEQTYKSRFSQIEKLSNAFGLLGLEIENEESEPEDYSGSKLDLISLFDAHQDFMKRWKLSIGKATGLMQLESLMQNRLQEYKWFAESWISLSDRVNDEDPDVKASVEMDPMDLYNALKETEGEYDGSELLLKETKRLNLWLKINGYE